MWRMHRAAILKFTTTNPWALSIMHSTDPSLRVRILLLGLAFLLAGCSGTTQEKQAVQASFPIESLDSLLFHQLQTRRIVMFGDGGHGVGYYMRTMTTLLSAWTDSLARDTYNQSIPSKICLIVEKDSVQQLLLENYIACGNTDEVLSSLFQDHILRYSNSFSLEYLEYLSCLREVRERIALLQRRYPSRGIEFQIMGAEPWPPFSDQERRTMSREEFTKRSFLWAAHQRDKLISLTIDRFLRDHPDFKALVFYGSAHLRRDEADKAKAFGSPEPELKGYFLAHFLDSLYGRQQVTVFRSPVPDGVPRPTGLFRSVIALYEKIDAPDFVFDPDPASTTFFPILFCPTQRTLKILEQTLSEYSHITTPRDADLSYGSAGYLYNLFKRSYLNTIADKNTLIDSMLTYMRMRQSPGTALKRISQISRSLARDFNTIENFHSLEKWISIVALEDTVAYRTTLQRFLHTLPVPSTGSDIATDLEERAMPPERQILKRKAAFVTMLMRSLYWLGTIEEWKEARHYLSTSIGRDS